MAAELSPENLDVEIQNSKIEFIVGHDLEEVQPLFSNKPKIDEDDLEPGSLMIDQLLTQEKKTSWIDSEID